VQTLKTQAECELSADGYDGGSRAQLVGDVEREALLAHLAGAVHEIANVDAGGV